MPHPNPLQRGDTIGLISPSSPLLPGAINNGIKYLEAKGFKIKVGQHARDSKGFFAGTDEDRANDIMDFFKDLDIKAIIATRGGHGSHRLLPLLDYEVIKKYPKILVGFSDTTALQLALIKKIGLPSFSGFTLTVQPTELLDQTLLSCLMGEPYVIGEGETVIAGTAKGPLLGGNLMLMTSLLGTPYQPDFKNSILFFEDVDIELHNIDLMLSQLNLAGVFEQVKGIIFGQFENCLPRNTSDGTIEDVITEWSSRFKVPCVKNFPYGHGAKKSVLPLGRPAFLDADAGILKIS
jgi:muramoyltetrapeptide carboxypeptidase